MGDVYRDAVAGFDTPGQGVDLPLSETGLQQAETVGNYLSDLKFTNAFVSDLQRARQVSHVMS